MAAKTRRYIHPTTRDYVVDTGGYQSDPGFTSKVVLALATKLGTCIVNPTFGSRLHEVKRWDEVGRRLTEKYAAEALEHLLSEIVNMTIVVEMSAKKSGLFDVVVQGERGTEKVSASYSAKVA